ncbi:MAG: caspase family protein [Pseudomonadota bacterium]
MRLLAIAFLGLGVLLQAQPLSAGKRVALIIGQNNYSALSKLSNPGRDAERMASILANNGFKVISCDGKRPGCFDQTRGGLLKALSKLEIASLDAELALVFYAGHGLETEFGNILAPIDANVDCDNYNVERGVLIEQFLLSLSPAKQRIIIIDACRDNPLQAACPPPPSDKALSFADIKVPAARDFLMVTSTKPGQQAQDGPPGNHSPFATALFAELEEQPGIYFDQVFNRVAKAVIEATKETAFTQLPEILSRGGAPEACLRGGDCAADRRALALAGEVAALKKARARDQELTRVAQSYLEQVEKRQGRKLTPQERREALREYASLSRDLAGRDSTTAEAAIKRLKAGDKSAAERLFEEDLNELEAAETRIEASRSEMRKRMASAARHVAALNRFSNVAKAMQFYEKSVRHEPDNALTWENYAVVAVRAGQTTKAATAYRQAIVLAERQSNIGLQFHAQIGLGEIALSRGRLDQAEDEFATAAATARNALKKEKRKFAWKRNITIARQRQGDVQRLKLNYSGALRSYRQALELVRDLQTVEDSLIVRRDMAMAYSNIGLTLRLMNNLDASLTAFRQSYWIRKRLSDENPENNQIKRELAISYSNVGDVHWVRGNLAAAKANFQATLEIFGDLVRDDPSNFYWQRGEMASLQRVGDIERRQRKYRAALRFYQRATDIADRMAAHDSKNARTTLDRALNYAKLGEIYMRLRDRRTALEKFYTARAILKPVVARTKNQTWKEDLKVIEQNIKALGR